MEETRVAKRSSKRLGWALTAGALAGVLTVGGVAFAGPDKWGRGGPPGLAWLHLVHTLDLTEQQELQAIKIRRNLHAQGKELREEMKAPMSQALDELEKPTPDASKLHEIADQGIQKFGKLIHSAIDQFLGLHATLTPEQREKLVTRAREAQAHTGEDHGDHLRGPGKRAKNE